MSDYRRNFALALSNAAMRRRGDSRQGATQHSSQRIGSAGRRRKAVRSYEKGKSKLGANVKCKHCNGSGSVLSHLNPYDGHKIGAGMGMHRCNYCGGSGKIYDHYATPGAAAAPREKTKRVVWFFGLFGALFGGVLQPWGMDWFVGAVLGFVAAGMAAGFMSEFRLGRVILGVIGVALVSLMVAAIIMGGGD